MEFIKLKDLHELNALPHTGKKVYFLAGGTDLMVQLRDHLLSEDCCMADISSLKSLCYIKEEDREIKIGSLTTFTDILESKLLQDLCPVLPEAVRTIGAPQIRNRGTLGGNLANASPAGDSIPALFVQRARIRTNLKTYPIHEFFLGVKESILKNAEMILEVIIPLEPSPARSFYYKSSPRNALAISKASLAVSVYSLENCIRWIRLAAGAVGITVVHLRRTEEFLLEKKITQDIIREAKKIARSEIAPIDDFRSTKNYRSEMVAYFLENALKEL